MNIGWTDNHRNDKATLLVLQKKFVNKATYDCIFANSSPIFTTFGILVNNDIVDRSHDLGYHGNHFGRKICVAIVTKMGIFLNWLVQGEYRVYKTVWYIIGMLITSAFQWCLMNSDIVYIKIIMGNSTVSSWKMVVCNDST